LVGGVFALAFLDCFVVDSSSLESFSELESLSATGILEAFPLTALVCCLGFFVASSALESSSDESGSVSAIIFLVTFPLTDDFGCGCFLSFF